MPSLAISYSGESSRSFFTTSITLAADVIHFFLGVEAAEAEADRGVRQIVADAQRLQHVAGLERRRGAGRAARHRDVVDAHQQRFAFDVGEADVQVVRQPVLHRAVDVDLVELGSSSRPCSLSRRNARRFDSSGISALADARRPRPSPRCPARSACRNACRARARRRPSARSAARAGLRRDVQRAHALRAVHLVRADRHQVDVVLDARSPEPCRPPARRRCGTARRVSLAILPISAHRLEHADFVVGVHDADQDRLVGDGVAQHVQVDQAVRPAPADR